MQLQKLPAGPAKPYATLPLDTAVDLIDDAKAVWQHGAANCGAPVASGVAKTTR